MPLREEEFLALLNSAPVVDGRITETLEDLPLRRVRDDLQRVIRKQADPAVLAPHLDGITQAPALTAQGVRWVIDGPADLLPAAEMVLEWAHVQEELPGRLRACANPECNKFLIDHSKPNTAKWCSMAVCGNRMKARRFHARRAEDANA